MIILLYYAIMNVVIPQALSYTDELLNLLMPCIIIFAGIIFLFGCMGMNISNNLGAVVIGGFIRGIARVSSAIVRAIVWIGINILRLIPRVFVGSRREYSRMGCKPVLSNILAVITTLIVLAIII